MFVTLTQYSSTIYWSVIITETLVIILFIVTWLHVNTMTKRHDELLKQMKQLHKRLDETNELIDDLFDEKPPQQPQGYMPMYPVQQQQFQPPYQPPR